MTRKQMDARVLRSRQILRDAAISLLAESDAFSVAQLLDLAGITRGTFYRHYRNKADLIDDVNELLVAEICQYAHGRFQVKEAISVIANRAAFYQAVFNQHQDPLFKSTLLANLRACRDQTIARLGRGASQRRLIYQWEVVMAGFWSVMALWLKDDMAFSKQELLQEFRAIWRCAVIRTQQTGLILFDFDG
ncbi:TetR family transcriptional regulator [Leuconostocaceae bacterium ESL0958]|nr:TetR family transcriptional regulator [Leuconostocaceae bacterium ESL0958]